MTNIEKIRQEIDTRRQHMVEELMGHEENCEYHRIKGMHDAYVDLLTFLDYSLPEEKPSEDLEGKQMIKELKERIVGLDNNGNPIAAAPPDIPMIVEKVNEIIRYINERGGDHFREPTKTMEEEALSWAGSSAVDAFKAGVEWLKEQDAARRK